MSNNRAAPWNDFTGHLIFEGDTIKHPDNTTGQVIFDNKADRVGDQWLVDYGYGDGILSRLCLQIGDKGRAEVVI